MDKEKKVVMDLGSAWNVAVKDIEQGRIPEESTINIVNMLAQKPALLELLEGRSK